MNARRCVLAGSIALCAAASLSFAEDPPVTAKIIRLGRTHSSLHDLRFKVTIANSGNDPSIVYSIRLRCPPELGSRDCKDGSILDGLGSNGDGIELAAGESTDQELRIPDRSGFAAFVDYSLLFFTKGAVRVGGSVSRSIGDQPRADVSFGDDIEFDPPIVSLFIAAACGVVAGAIFLWLSSAAEQRRKNGSVDYRRLAVDGGLDVGSSCALAVIAVIILTQTTALTSVVNVRLLDFYGGFLVGLLVQSRRGELFEAVSKLITAAKTPSPTPPPPTGG